MAEYPTGLPTLREVENDPGVAYDALQKNVVFAEDVNDIAAEILAIATELGTLPKGGFDDVKARLADMTAKTATAQSTAANKGDKITKAMRYLWFNGESGQRVQNPASQNTVYPILGYSGTTPYTATVTVAKQTFINNVNITFECIMWTSQLIWIEGRVVIDGVAYGGWTRIFGGGSNANFAMLTVGATLSPGTHTVSMEYRNPSAGGASVSYDQRRFKIHEVIDL